MRNKSHMQLLHAVCCYRVKVVVEVSDVDKKRNLLVMNRIYYDYELN